MNNHRKKSGSKDAENSIWEVEGKDVDLDRVDTYDYELDEAQIAAEPADRRDGSRLLIYDGTADNIGHDRFENLGTYLRAGDLLVFNDTRVVPARLRMRKQTGGRVELFVLEPLEGGSPEQWIDKNAETLSFRCMTRSSKPMRPGMILSGDTSEQMPPVEILSASAGRATARVVWDGSLLDFLETYGEVPLPPYIVRRRKNEGRSPVEADDLSRYQTIYADRPGAVAAPTAGLHFTNELLARLDDQGVQRATVTLTVGPGTFAPVRHDCLSDHEMHHEDYFVPEGLAGAIAACRARGGRVVAVGTTSARALESEARRPTPFMAGWRSTDLFLRPGEPFKAIDGLITNFHLPRSTLLALVAGFATADGMRRIYESAVNADYRFYSYGDASLILRPHGSPPQDREASDE